MIDYYWTLGIRMGASQGEIKAAYRRAALRNHPDRGGSEAKMKAVNAAYETLSNPDRRARYDRELAHFWDLAEKWARNAHQRTTQTAPPPPPWATGKWQTQTTRRPPRPKPPPWRYWPVRITQVLIVVVYGNLAYGAALEGPWGLLLLMVCTGYYILGACWVNEVVEDIFLR